MFLSNNNKKQVKNQEPIFLIMIKDLKFISLFLLFFISLFLINKYSMITNKIISLIPINFIMILVFLTIGYNFINYLIYLRDKKEIINILAELENIRNRFYFRILKDSLDPKIEKEKTKIDINIIKENGILKKIIDNLTASAEEEEKEEAEIISIEDDEEEKIENKVKKEKKVKKEVEIEEHLKKPKELKVLQAIFIDFMLKLKEKTLKNINVGRLLLCGNFLSFLRSKKGNYKLRKANLCNNRFCPICSWVEAKRNAFKILELLMYAREIEKKGIIFMTLTVPNVEAQELEKAIKHLNSSFKRLMETKKMENICKGYIRKLEVTYNAEANTYHPHFHILVAVNKSYFTSRDYIKILDLLEMWRKATRDNSITQVDLREAKMNSIKEVMEIATYTTKMKDLYSNEEVFMWLYGALFKKQLITYNGLFKDLKKLQDNKQLDITKIKKLTEAQDKATEEITYKWQSEKKEYEEYYVRELKEEEIEKFYNFNFDEY